ncbi:MAG: Ig-like domain-containing protein [Bacteroidota bacterium]
MRRPSTTQLADVTTAGIWTSNNEAVATVDVDGLVTAVSAGTATISYAVTNTCGTTTVSTLVTVNTVPAVEQSPAIQRYVQIINTNLPALLLAVYGQVRTKQSLR